MYEDNHPTTPGHTPNHGEVRWAMLKHDLHQRLIQAIDHEALRDMDETQIRQQLRLGAEMLCRTHPELLSAREQNRLIDELVDEILGYGPLESLLQDESISDILINGTRSAYIERAGKLEEAPVLFRSEKQLLSTVQKIAARAGRRIDESSPMVDARLPDGSRVNAIISPLAIDGTLVSIRRAAKQSMSPQAFCQNGSATTRMMQYLKRSITGRQNMIISGSTGSGKTTLLNLLSSFIPEDQRVVTIEDSAELQLQQSHVARLETRPPNLEGAGEVTARDLLRNALRMRPDRIIIGECRGEEALDMLQAMSTGHDGSLTTIHANSAVDALARLEMLVELAGFDLSHRQIVRQIASAVQMVVHISRTPGGSRRITQIVEVRGMRDGELILNKVFPGPAKQHRSPFPSETSPADAFVGEAPASQTAGGPA